MRGRIAPELPGHPYKRDQNSVQSIIILFEEENLIRSYNAISVTLKCLAALPRKFLQSNSPAAISNAYNSVSGESHGQAPVLEASLA